MNTCIHAFDKLILSMLTYAARTASGNEKRTNAAPLRCARNVQQHRSHKVVSDLRK